MPTRVRGDCTLERGKLGPVPVKGVIREGREPVDGYFVRVSVSWGVCVMCELYPFVRSCEVCCAELERSEKK